MRGDIRNNYTYRYSEYCDQNKAMRIDHIILANNKKYETYKETGYRKQ